MQESVEENTVIKINRLPIMGPAEWKSLVETWKKSSDISLRDFCKKHQVHPSSFCYWISKDKKQPNSQAISFAKVQINKSLVVAEESKSKIKIKAKLPCGTQLQLTTDCCEVVLALIKGLRQC
jgi:hypothetical protein